MGGGPFATKIPNECLFTFPPSLSPLDLIGSAFACTGYKSLSPDVPEFLQFQHCIILDYGHVSYLQQLILIQAITESILIYHGA